MSWKDIPMELLSEINKKLEMVDVIRSSAVCSWWASISYEEKKRRTSQIPWLMLSSKDKTSSRYFYSLTEKKTYEFNLSDISGQHCVGSSQGYLFSVDDNANLIITNPLKSGDHIPLPPTFSLPYFPSIHQDSSGRIIEYEVRGDERDYFLPVEHTRDYHYQKTILSADRNTVVAIETYKNTLLFLRLGDKSWSQLKIPTRRESPTLRDVLFHDGLIYTIDTRGTAFAFDLNHPKKLAFKSHEGPLREDASPSRYLVESPCRNILYLVCRCYKYIEDDIPRTNNFKVFRMDKVTKKWKRISILGDVSFFLGFNCSVAYNASEFPYLKKNCIYFTDDYKEGYVMFPEFAGDVGVFDMSDASIGRLYEDNNLDRLDWPPPIWFEPKFL